ncbi:SRPBCC domain-containing protein [Nocardia sp. CDC159]|uniref:SRPBCC domain-containing protein n=1 Tax=Nocardia pulmonis TaxID=2951408 RepID=A0A9X2E6Y8_9NOCA|nr:MULTISPECIES: SRPBCC domain-containing protein [Nocardia]MCM6775247.1 SRPBCC domain-containing protein [Nocardia pulmonis]MCM6788019.1 SRPBCC domain-containing protein [Nocardia sp. CDC159]
MAFVIDDSVEIAASAEVVWKVLTDFERYGEWNPFVSACATTLEPGSPIDMRVQLGPRQRAQREWIRSHTPGTEFSYAMKPLPLGALRSLRSHTLTPLTPTITRYTSHFELDGWLRPLVTVPMGKALQSGFTAMTAALKTRAEQLA